MKIVTRKEFLQLPEGTVYQKFTPNCLDEISVKSDTVNHSPDDSDGVFGDFRTMDITRNVDGDDMHECDVLFDKAVAGVDVPMHFHTEHRDGLFDKDQLFAVWSKEDVKGLIARLQETLDA